MSRKPLNKVYNICLVAQHFPILGRASDHGFLWPIAKGLAAAGHEVTVLSARSPMGKSEIVRDKVKAYYLYEGTPNLSGLKFEDAVYEKFLTLHSQKPFDLVHSIDASGYKIARQKRQLRLAVAYDVEATQMSQLFSIYGMAQDTISSLLSTSFAVAYKFATTYYGHDRALLDTADGIFVTSPQQRIVLERYYLYPDYHTYSVPYGIELGDLTVKEPSTQLKQELGIPEKAHIVVTLSDMTEIGELKNLLVAFERVAVKKPNAYLIIVGNGSLWKKVEYEVLNLALGRRVIMTGAIKTQEVGDYLALADVFVNLSSRTTGFEPSIIEAMAYKKVIIGSEVSPIANIVEDGQDGFLLRPADTQSLSQLLLEIFNGQIPVTDIGERARTKVINIFDTKKMVEAIVAAYRKILSESGLYKMVQVESDAR
ncbi:MAG: glycosyltransferase family 4 protein [Pseudobdellovibrionaceae bacterium]